MSKLSWLLLVLVVNVFPQNPDAEVVRTLNGEILRLHSLIQRADPIDRPALRARAKPLLERRLTALSTLIRNNPREALEIAFPASILTELHVSFGQLSSMVETYGTWHGKTEYFVADEFTSGRSVSVVRMHASSEKLTLHFTDPKPPMLNGDILSVRGLRTNRQVAVETARRVSGGNSEKESVNPQQSIRIILVNLRNYSLPRGANKRFMEGVVFGNDLSGERISPNWSLNGFWRQHAGDYLYNMARPEVLGPFTLSQDYKTGECFKRFEELRRDAVAASRANVPDGWRLLVVYPDNGECRYSGLATIGDGWAMQNADRMGDRKAGVALTSHELGHNMGLLHANSIAFGNEPLGPIGDFGTQLENGDPYSAMGRSEWGFYGADADMHVLGWLSTPDKLSVVPNFYRDVSTSGSYSIRWFGQPRTLLPKALRIRRGNPANGRYLIVEFRQPLDIYDTRVPSEGYKGALVHYRDEFTGGGSQLIDFSPGDDNGFLDPVLKAGQTWQDPYSDLSLRVDSIVPKQELNLTVNYGSTRCTHAAPALTISPANAATQRGRPLDYSIQIKNNDSAACPPTNFNLNSDLPEEWSEGTFSPLSLTLRPGEKGRFRLTKMPPADAPFGTYLLSVTARSSDQKGSRVTEAARSDRGQKETDTLLTRWVPSDRHFRKPILQTPQFPIDGVRHLLRLPRDSRHGETLPG